MSSIEVQPLLTANLPSKLRRAIGLIAAYALALQAILGSIAPHLTAPFDPTLPFDLAAICLGSHGAGVAPAADIPNDSGNGSQASYHCAMCTSSAPPLLALPDSFRVAAYPGASKHIVPAPAVLPLSKTARRPGGARAPPTIA
jgi:hypothetical protein